MESTAFPWMTDLTEEQAHAFILKLGSALDYDGDEEPPSWEEVLAGVDRVVHKFKTIVDVKALRPGKSEG
jgi:hypothetical protein